VVGAGKGKVSESRRGLVGALGSRAGGRAPLRPTPPLLFGAALWRRSPLMSRVGQNRIFGCKYTVFATHIRPFQQEIRYGIRVHEQAHTVLANPTHEAQGRGGALPEKVPPPRLLPLTRSNSLMRHRGGGAPCLKRCRRPGCCRSRAQTRPRQ